MLKLENLTIRFGGLTAVDNVTTHVEQGEIFGLADMADAEELLLVHYLGNAVPVNGKYIHL